MLAFLSSKENLTTTFIEEISKGYNFPESRHNSLKCVGLSSYLSQFYSCLLLSCHVILFVSLFPVSAQRSQWRVLLTDQIIFLSFRSEILVFNHEVSHGWDFSSFSKPLYWIVYGNYMEKLFLGHLCELKLRNWHVSLWKVGLHWEKKHTPFPSTSRFNFSRELCKATTIRFYFFL